jgi:ribosomal protein L40E
MAETPRSTLYCLACGAENDPLAAHCRQCARSLGLSQRQRREGAAFLLNELAKLRAEGAMGEATYAFLRRRYLAVLRGEEEPPAPSPRPAVAPVAPAAPAAPAPAPTTPAPTPPAEPSPVVAPTARVREGPGWLAEQQANLLLYLGAFLIVVATLVFVSASGEAVGGGARMALLVIGTLVFLAGGLFCHRIPRVQEAGVVFFAVGALMVPLNFVGAYAFFFAEDDINPAGLWLGGSLTSALFYGAVSFTGLSRWYPVPAVVALLSALAAVLYLADAPPEAYPGAFIAFAFLLAAPATLRLGRVSEVFGPTWAIAAHVIVPAGFLAAISIAAVASAETGEDALELATRWYLPPTLGLAAAFYVAVSFTATGRWCPAAAAGSLLGVLAAILYASSAPVEAYPASYIALAFLLAAPATLRLGRTSEVFGQAATIAAHVVVPAAFVSAIWIAAAASGESGAEALAVTTLWYLPPTLGFAGVFYLTTAFTSPYDWTPIAAVVALFATLTAVLALSEAPVEAYPGSYIAFACLLAAPATLRLGRADEVLGPTGAVAAHLIVPASVVAAIYVAAASLAGERGDYAIDLATRWYLPPTLGLAAAFYWTQGSWIRKAVAELEPVLTVTALVVSGAAGVSILFGMDAEPQWYGIAIAIVGWFYAAGSPGFWPRWSGQQYLGWLALVTITTSWLVLEGLYVDQPRIGAGVHFSAALFYLAGARVVKGQVDLLALEASRTSESDEPTQPVLALPVAVPFIYAAGLTIALGYYYVLASLPAAEGAEASDLGLPFFYLSLGVIAVAVAMRWLWPEMRLHAYAVAIGLSLFVLLSSVEVEGRVALLLAIYGGIAFAIALWELEAFALVLPATYGFFALLAGWRYYTPDDAYLPLIIALIAWTLYATHAALRKQEQKGRWADVLLALAFVYAALAPIVGWVRLSQLADPEGFVGTQSFEATALYQTSAAGVALLGLLVGAEAWLRRRPEIAVGASALLLVALLLQIGHYRPENVQAYTAPLGVYLLAGALLGLRVRDLPGDLRELLGPLEALSAALIVGPSLVQSFDEGAWRYGVIVLAEGLALVSLALVQRRVWLLSISVGFVVLDSVHYLIEAGVPPIPTWAILAIAGITVMAAGTAILLGRDRWTEWQQAIIAWWNREPLPVSVE